MHKYCIAYSFVPGRAHSLYTKKASIEKMGEGKKKKAYIFIIKIMGKCILFSKETINIDPVEDQSFMFV